MLTKAGLGYDELGSNMREDHEMAKGIAGEGVEGGIPLRWWKRIS
jgi:hypothetical protein